MPPGEEGPEDKPPGQPSFNPRTWLDRQAPPPPSPPPRPEPAEDKASFDPKTWIQPQPPPAAAPPGRPPSRRGVWLAAGGLAVLATVGTAVLVSPRRRHRATAGGAASPSALPAAAAAGRVTFIADSIGDLQQQLTPRFSGADAAQASALLAPRLGDAAGQLRVTASPMAPVLKADNRISSLVVRSMADGAGARLDRQGDRLTLSLLAANLTVQLCATPQGVMNETSFKSSFDQVFQDEGLITQFAQAMAYDVNFMHDLSPGSEFRAVCEVTTDGDGNLVGSRRLVFASLDIAPFHDTELFEGVETAREIPARSLKLYLFAPQAGTPPAWFDEAGVGTVRGLMRTPVDGARVTSKFGLRVHPIYEIVKFHEGVDFGCPVGTPVYAAGDGVVLVAGPAQGFGNYLRIQHAQKLWTAYGHLSAYAPGIKPGVRVKQGQVVAFTGNTGNSTGPHLHFEIRVDDYRAVDPLTYQTDRTHTLEGAALTAFQAQRDRVDAVRNDCPVAGVVTG